MFVKVVVAPYPESVGRQFEPDLVEVQVIGKDNRCLDVLRAHVPFRGDDAIVDDPQNGLYIDLVLRQKFDII
ncbi:Uncharacterised protein [Mycobacterium tuberculosis]|nr:Uncharacterised protein [Mycobacterium tuberculosis]